ncbi:MAG TPA: hypothetical protein VL651_09490 [Bacteroidia bacterium]|jgi:hypothetical protein|nr:hypothetical protein [Bacteroidia bacterium]
MQQKRTMYATLQGDRWFFEVMQGLLLKKSVTQITQICTDANAKLKMDNFAL